MAGNLAVGIGKLAGALLIAVADRRGLKALVAGGNIVVERDEHFAALWASAAVGSDGLMAALVSTNAESMTTAGLENVQETEAADKVE